MTVSDKKLPTYAYPTSDTTYPSGKPQNFTLYEFLQSETATAKGLESEQYNPSTDVVNALDRLTRYTVQPARTAFGCSFDISSGYRSPELNKAVGGSTTSQHLTGEAADILVASSFTTDEKYHDIRKYIKDGIQVATSKACRSDVNAHFLLFAYFCLNIGTLKNSFKIDQVIHEYGSNGKPDWCHVSSSAKQCRGEMLIINSSGTTVYSNSKDANAYKSALKVGT